MCYGNLYKRYIIRGGRFLGNEEPLKLRIKNEE